MKFAITGGGTGGHLAVAKALCEALTQRGHEVIYIGSLSGQDRSWFEGTDSPFSHSYFLKTSGVVNQKGLMKIVALFKIVVAFLKALFLLRRHKTQALISVGGFSAAPASMAAVFYRIPFYIHEQNAKMGKLNAILKRFSNLFFSSYDEDSPVKSYPISATLFRSRRVRTKLKSIIFLGGSQGARAINDLAVAVAPWLQSKQIHIIHQCGALDYERMKHAYADLGIRVDLFAFSKLLPEKMAEADFAVSRAGASTLWELCAIGLPTFFVPYPYAASDHQFYNAQFIVKKELGWCEREAEDLPTLLISALSEPSLELKSKALMEQIGPDGATHIIQAIENNMKEH